MGIDVLDAGLEEMDRVREERSSMDRAYEEAMLDALD